MFVRFPVVEELRNSGFAIGTVDPEFPSDPKMPIRAHPFQVRNDNNNIYFKKELVRSRMFVRFPVVEELRNSGFAIGTADPEFP